MHNRQILERVVRQHIQFNRSERERQKLCCQLDIICNKFPLCGNKKRPMKKKKKPFHRIQIFFKNKNNNENSPLQRIQTK